MQGVITDIQRFSLTDGRGIRTTVFVKGCNMRCLWCHNPETIAREPQSAYYPAKCVGCGHCKTLCPTGARTTIGKSMSAKEIFLAVAADADYYAASGGGITVSGGEPLMQHEFTTELLALCHEAGIATAVETNLSLPYSRIEALLPYLDSLFFDIKLFDDGAHKKYTGVSNKSLLENALRLPASLDTVVRTPLIPGITDGEDNIAAIAQFLTGVPGLSYYELLNYNALAAAKYPPIGQEYALPELSPLPEERVETLVKTAGKYVPARCGQE